jgi:hypothetical protein
MRFLYTCSQVLLYSPIGGGIIGATYGLYGGAYYSIKDNEKYKFSPACKGFSIILESTGGCVTYGICGFAYPVTIPCYLYHKHFKN